MTSAISSSSQTYQPIFITLPPEVQEALNNRVATRSQTCECDEQSLKYFSAMLIRAALLVQHGSFLSSNLSSEYFKNQIKIIDSISEAGENPAPINAARVILPIDPTLDATPSITDARLTMEQVASLVDVVVRLGENHRAGETRILARAFLHQWTTALQAAQTVDPIKALTDHLNVLIERLSLVRNPA